MKEIVAALNEALEAGYAAMNALAEMPRGPTIGGLPGPLRGFVMCRVCLYAAEGKLLIRKRAVGRHLRSHTGNAAYGRPLKQFKP